MKKIILLASAIAMMFIFTACGEPTPTDVATCFLNGIKTEDARLIDITYGDLNVDEVIDSDRTLSKYAEDPAVREAIDYNIRSFEFSTLGEEIESDTATVTANITYCNLGKVMEDNTKKWFETVTSFADLTKDGVSTRAKEILAVNADRNEEEKEKITINLINTDEGWKVEKMEDNKELFNVLTCKIKNGASAVNQSFDAKVVAEKNKKKKEESDRKKEQARKEAEQKKAEEQKRAQEQTQERKQERTNRVSSSFRNDTITTSEGKARITHWETQTIGDGRVFVIHYNFTNNSNSRLDPKSFWNKHVTCSLAKKDVKGLKNSKISKGQSVNYAAGYEINEESEATLTIKDGNKTLGTRVFK